MSKKIPKTEQPLHAKCQQLNIKFEGTNPVELNMAELRKCAVAIGANIVGDRCDILQSVVDTLAKRGVSMKSTTSSSSKDTNEIDPIAIGTRILALAENDDDEGILNLGINNGSDKITRDTAPGLLRKAYLKLSLVIHPDRLKWNEATKAFQALVKAFERLSSPDLIAEEKATSRGSRGDTKENFFQISRSNEGCERTRVSCPRCKVAWNEGTLDGNPDYYYNFLMMGIKSYHCSTCLFQFGAMTAVHRCSHCNGIFEYSPTDYHKKIICTRDKCKKKFGFMMYHASNRIIEELKKSVKEEQQLFLKGKEAKLRRNARSKSTIDEEVAFTLGLMDQCPRCGEELDFEDADDAARARLHLMECNDVTKHAEHRKKKVEDALKDEKKNEKQQAQEAVQRQAAWELLGSKTNQLWILDDDQVKKQAAIENVDHLKSGSERVDIINEIARKRQKTDGTLMIDRSLQNNNNNNKSSALVTTTSSKKKKSITIDDIPSNYKSLSATELKTILACMGMLDSKRDMSKNEMIKVIDKAVYDDDDSDDDDKNDDDDDDYVDLVSP